MGGCIPEAKESLLQRVGAWHEPGLLGGQAGFGWQWQWQWVPQLLMENFVCAIFLALCDNFVSYNEIRFWS